MKTQIKKIVRLTLLVGAVVCSMLLPSKSEAQTLGSAPNSFVNGTNVSQFISNNIVVSVTNNVYGLTNLLTSATTNTPSTGLFSVFYNPTGTNGSFVAGTNSGIINVAGSRFATFQFSGIASAPNTNTILLAGSAYPNPLNSQVETVPTWKITFTNGTGAFNWVTNIEDDALGAWQLASWGLPAGGNITNPVVAWHLQ